MALTRRQLMARAGAAGAALAVGPGIRGASATEDGTITIAMAARQPGGLNPHVGGLTAGDNLAIYQIFDTLAKNPDQKFATRPDEFEPSLAESWEMSEDAKIWTYKLRQGVQFHKNYGEMTSADVLFSIGRHLDPALNTNSRIQFANIVRMDAPDDYTVVFTLERPDPLFNGTCMSTLSASIFCKKAFEEKGEAFNMDPVGTGPYQVESVSAENGVMLGAFEDHFSDPAVTARINIRYMADTTARTLAFASGQVDMIEGVRAPGWTDTMRQRSPDIIFDKTVPGSFNALHLNLNQAPLDNLLVRQAIRYAVDNVAMAQAYGDLAKPLIGLIAPQFAGSVTREELPEELKYVPDLSKAKALLAEAGYPNGVTIPCFTSAREDYTTIMLIVQEQLRGAGITLDLQIIDHNAFHAENRADKNRIAPSSVSWSPSVINIFLNQAYSSAEVKADGSGGANYSHYGVAIPGIDDLLDAARNEPDFDKVVELVKEIERKILTDLPILGTITLSFVVARHPRLDLGINLESGPAYWRLSKAKYVG